MNQPNPFDAEIIISTLKRSSLPTILVEGDTEIMLFGNIEKMIGNFEVDFIPCGGRITLLTVFERRSEFSHLKVSFIADQDMWLFTGVPHEYADIWFTSGNCIENDLYKDGKNIIIHFLFPSELTVKELLTKNISKWFAYQVELWKTNPSAVKIKEVSLLSEKYIDKQGTNFKTEFLEECGFQEVDNELFNTIYTDYETKLRGKFIFQIFKKIFEQFRRAQDKNAIIYSDKQLIDICYIEGLKREESCIQKLLTKIKTEFGV